MTDTRSGVSPGTEGSDISVMDILVVDDDPVGLMVARTVVESLGHTVTTATDGEQAWQLILTERFDVVLTDREMPGLDGLELCRRVRTLSRKEPGARAYAYVILLTGHDDFSDALEGMQAGADDYLSKPLDPAQLKLRLVAAERVTELHAQLARQQRELAALNDAQHALARRDALTLLPNRRALQEELDRLDARAQRYGYRYSLALLDIDHFKTYNDTAGHVAGDEALRAVADALSAQVRQTDCLYRYGGEEFVLVIDTDSPDGALIAAERLRAAVHALGLPHPARSGAAMTVSAGVATSELSRTGSQALLGAADTALYRAKRDGRNQTCQAPSADDGVVAGPVEVAPRDLLDPAPLRAMYELGLRIGRAIAEEVVRTYVKQSDERLSALQAALDHRADTTLARGAHALKSSSATIGATAVSRLCAELEQAHLWQRRSQLVDELHTLAAATNSAIEEQLQALLKG